MSDENRPQNWEDKYYSHRHFLIDSVIVIQTILLIVALYHFWR